MPRSNRNFPDDPTPPWQERDKAPNAWAEHRRWQRRHAPDPGEQVMPEVDGDRDEMGRGD